VFTPADLGLGYRSIRDMFTKELHQQGYTRKFTVSDRRRDGWEIRAEEDNRVLKQAVYTDWHRVERALSLFTLEIGELESRGWAIR
jgi:hypothetical protein